MDPQRLSLADAPAARAEAVHFYAPAPSAISRLGGMLFKTVSVASMLTLATLAGAYFTQHANYESPAAIVGKESGLVHGAAIHEATPAMVDQAKQLAQVEVAKAQAIAYTQARQQTEVLEREAEIKQRAETLQSQTGIAQLADSVCALGVVAGLAGAAMHDQDFQQGGATVAQASCGISGAMRRGITDEQSQVIEGKDNPDSGLTLVAGLASAFLNSGNAGSAPDQPLWKAPTRH